jgi:hypothetical protein
MGYDRNGAECLGCGVPLDRPCAAGGCNKLDNEDNWVKFIRHFKFDSDKYEKYTQKDAEELLRIVNNRFKQKESKGRPSFLYHQTQESLSSLSRKNERSVPVQQEKKRKLKKR